mmetsp:Transcript_17940/g.32755  ORF Transcript_17940/g.32755 Transcript_17940/m.32755 type:complete len:99 (-) Transcript_17940:404-700(-)
MPSEESSISKSGRAVCYLARDNFYKCCREQGVDWMPETKIPSKCSALRKEFQKKCLASWVTHFDSQQEANVRKARAMSMLINNSASNAAGGLAGKKID